MIWTLWFEYKCESFISTLLWHAQIHPAQMFLPDCIWHMALHGVQVEMGISLLPLWLSVLSALIQRLILLILSCIAPFHLPFHFQKGVKEATIFSVERHRLLKQSKLYLDLALMISIFFLHFGGAKSNELDTSLKLRKWTWHLHSDWGQTSYLAWLPGNSKGFLLVFKNVPYIM